MSSLGGAAPRELAQGADGLAEAEAELGYADTGRADAETQLAAARTLHRDLLTRLNQLNTEQRSTLNRLESVRANAQSLAVAAYIRGGAPDDLATTIDVQRATEAAWRKVFTVGRVDQAQEAAAKLRDVRSRADEVLFGLAGDVDRVGTTVEAASENLHRAANRQVAARSELARQQRAAQAAQAARAAETKAAAANQPKRPASGGSTPPITAAEPDQPDPDPDPSPAPTGDNEWAWEQLRQCESGGNYRAISPNGLYRGAYQFDRSTWASVGGSGDPAAASPAEQDKRAHILYDLAGKSPWPECGRHLP